MKKIRLSAPLELASARLILTGAAFILGFFLFATLKARALSVEVYVPEKYTIVEAGERFYFEIDIKYPENPKRKDLRMIYQIKKSGELVAESKFLKAVETQASFMDFIVMPENAEKGLYHINVIVSDYENLNEEISATFNVVKSKQREIQIYFFVILGAVVLVAALLFVQIALIKRRIQ